MSSDKESIDAITLLEMSITSSNYEDIVTYLDTAQKTSPYFSFYKIINKTKNKMLIQMNLCASFGSRAIIRSGCFLKECIIDEEGIIFNLLTSDDDSLYTFMEYLTQRKHKLNIIKKQDYKKLEILTPREKEILSVAYEHGYFCTPKKIKLWELANELDITVSCLNELLRKAENKIISHYFITG